MVGYKLSKNDWVTPFFVIFRSVREKLLVTVSFDHPVPVRVKLPVVAPLEEIDLVILRPNHSCVHFGWNPTETFVQWFWITAVQFAKS